MCCWLHGSHDRLLWMWLLLSTNKLWLYLHSQIIIKKCLRISKVLVISNAANNRALLVKRSTSSQHLYWPYPTSLVLGESSPPWRSRTADAQGPSSLLPYYSHLCHSSGSQISRTVDNRRTTLAGNNRPLCTFMKNVAGGYWEIGTILSGSGQCWRLKRIVIDLCYFNSTIVSGEITSEETKLWKW